jgi:O-succinylbenzoic acid--CoA ligase
MSETCGGCVYDAVPLEGVQVAVRGGRIWLGGDVVASGYRAAPSLTEGSFKVEEGGQGPVRWYKTDDRGELSADGRLNVFGRVDDVIITGGLKVSANLVADQLKLVAGVRDAFVLGLPDKEWGQRVTAAVVGSCTLEELIADAATVLAAHAVPKTVLFVPEIPLLATGKPDRLALAKLLAGAGPIELAN